MTRQALVRILLSLLLLISQQMASSHVLSHLMANTSAQQALSDNAVELKSAVAQEQSCHQCLAFAQLGTPLGHDQLVFMPHANGVRDSGPVELPSAGSQTILAFQSRGPPQA